MSERKFETIGYTQVRCDESCRHADKYKFAGLSLHPISLGVRANGQETNQIVWVCEMERSPKQADGRTSRLCEEANVKRNIVELEQLRLEQEVSDLHTIFRNDDKEVLGIVSQISDHPDVLNPGTWSTTIRTAEGKLWNFGSFETREKATSVGLEGLSRNLTLEQWTQVRFDTEPPVQP